MRYFIASLTVCLTACATSPARYDAEMSKWVGRSVDQLVTEWGPPHAQATLTTGERVLEWTDTARGRVATTVGTTTILPGTESCTTRFLVGTGGVVKSVRAEGGLCRI